MSGMEMALVLWAGVMGFWLGWTKGYEEGWLANGRRLGRMIRDLPKVRAGPED